MFVRLAFPVERTWRHSPSGYWEHTRHLPSKITTKYNWSASSASAIYDQKRGDVSWEELRLLSNNVSTTGTRAGHQQWKNWATTDTTNNSHHPTIDTPTSRNQKEPPTKTPDSQQSALDNQDQTTTTNTRKKHNKHPTTNKGVWKWKICLFNWNWWNCRDNGKKSRKAPYSFWFHEK